MSLFKYYKSVFRVYSIFLPHKAAMKAVRIMTTPRIKSDTSSFSKKNANQVIKLKNGGLLSVYGIGHKKILLLHGWSGCLGQFEELMKKIDVNEYTVYAVHPVGHWESDLFQSHPGRFVEALYDAYNYLDVSFDFAIGHSLGASALLYFETKKKCFNDLILISAPSNIKSVLDRFSKVLCLSKNSKKIFIRRMEEIVGVNLKNINLVELSKSIDKQVFIFHDVTDKQVPFKEAIKLNEAILNGKLIKTKGVGHTRILSDKNVINEIVECLDR